MGGGISKMAKHELVATIRDRYQQASKKDKRRILDELTAITGHNRKHGIRLLRGAATYKKLSQKDRSLVASNKRRPQLMYTRPPFSREMLRGNGDWGLHYVLR